MSEKDSKRPEAARSRPDTDVGRKVWAEVYPGGDMMIEVGGVEENAELYLCAGEPEALKDVLEELLDGDLDE